MAVSYEYGEACLCAEEGFGSPIKGFEVMEVTRVMRARVIGAPVETGQVSFDNKVRDPYDVVVRGKIVVGDDDSAEETVEKLVEMINNRDFKFYSVTDGFNCYDHLTLTQFPLTRTPKEFDWLDVTLRFSEMMLVQAKEAKSANSEHSATRSCGYTAGQ